jgi:hypothetical protein
MRITNIHLACLVGVLSAACTAPFSKPPWSATNTVTSASVAPAPVPESVLYARDGTPVTVGGKGAARVEQEPKRDFAEAEGGRASLLELYTNAVAEKIALTEEVIALKATLEKERKDAGDGVEERTVLRGEFATLSRERDALKAETLDLAARLTTAQIARLEAQKALLEMQIDARMREEAAATVQASPKDKDKKRSGGEHK